MRKPNGKGFTLAELLIVVAIIAVLVVIGIPIFTTQLEKSRESADAANIRAQYARVMSEAVLGTKSINADGTDYGKIELKQKKDNWQTKNVETNLYSVFADVEGHPVVQGTAWVSYDLESGKVILHFGESDGTAVLNSYSALTISSLNVKTLGKGYYCGDETGLTDEQKELIAKLKAYFGYEEMTAAFDKHGNYKGTYLVTVAEGIYPETDKSKTVTGTRIFFDKNTGEVVAVWEQPGTWGPGGQADNTGFWGVSGKQTIVYECENIVEYQ